MLDFLKHRVYNIIIKLRKKRKICIKIMMNVIITIVAMGFAFVGGIACGFKALLIKAREKMLPKDFLEFREKIEKIME